MYYFFYFVGLAGLSFMAFWVVHDAPAPDYNPAQRIVTEAKVAPAHIRVSSGPRVVPGVTQNCAIDAVAGVKCWGCDHACLESGC